MPEEALNVIKCLPVLEELDIEPTEEEVKEALGSPSSGKAPCQDGFELKSGSACSKDDAFSKLYEILSALARG